MSGTETQLAETSGGQSTAVQNQPSPQDRPELSQEEFDPVGTLTLILIYFGILAVLWFVMYFVEFASGPTVVG